MPRKSSYEVSGVTASNQQIPVACMACTWEGARYKHTDNPCPWCGGDVVPKTTARDPVRQAPPGSKAIEYNVRFTLTELREIYRALKRITDPFARQEAMDEAVLKRVIMRLVEPERV